MNHYETNIIIKPTLSLSQVKKLVEKVVKMVKTSKGNIVYQSTPEIKSLAYPIQKHEKGYYQLLEFQAPSDFIAPLEVFYKRDEDIIRYVTIALDKHGIAYNQEKKKAKKNVTQKRASSKEEEKDQQPADEKVAPTKKMILEQAPVQDEKEAILKKETNQKNEKEQKSE